jgi:tRNA(adenine34) deaminase
MERALALAQAAGEAGEVPVGALLLSAQGTVLAEAANRRERDCDPTGHAEIVALRRGCQVLQNWHLTGCTLYVTLEPCPMCAGAILQARVQTLVYAAPDPKAGAIRSVLNLPGSPASFHRLEIIAGILKEPAQVQLQAWFAQRR